MRQPLRRSLVVSLCVLVCAAGAIGAIAPLWRAAGYVRAEDRNGDGRPDIWNTYDRRGQLAEVTVDTNFDGRSDVHEYYDRGALLRRESDRDFDNRVDLIQEFDPATREHTRSVVDVDFDGTADLLVLFRDGKPVFSKWAQPAQSAQSTVFAAPSTRALYADARPRASTGQPAALEDPFSRDLSVSPARRASASGGYIGLSTSGGLPSGGDLVDARAPSSEISGLLVRHPSSSTVSPYSPRGPPVQPLFI
jgi:hypothetical protein